MQFSTMVKNELPHLQASEELMVETNDMCCHLLPSPPASDHPEAFGLSLFETGGSPWQNGLIHHSFLPHLLQALMAQKPALKFPSP